MRYDSLCPWAQDELPFAYPGVRTFEPAYAILVLGVIHSADLYTVAAVREQVEVDYARSVPECLCATDEPLCALQDSQDVKWSK